jgi:hypothetical protein
LALLLSPVKAEITPTPLIVQEYKTPIHHIISAIPSELGYNCVEYVKTKKSVPQGLGTLSQKKSHIRTTKPEKGLVGVTAEGPIGHMVFIEEVKENSLIISDSNYRHGYVTWREIPKDLVLGYY